MSKENQIATGAFIAGVDFALLLFVPVLGNYWYAPPLLISLIIVLIKIISMVRGK